MNNNPDTINKLIGAKVTSFKSVTEAPLKNKKDSKETVEDLKLKEDKHQRTKIDATDFYDSSEESEVIDLEQARDRRVNEAMKFLSEESGQDLYSSDKPEEPQINEEALIKRGTGKLMGGPGKRWYKPGFIHRKQVRKHYDSARRDLVGAGASILAKKNGMDPIQVAGMANGAGDIVANVGRGAAKNIKRYLKNR